MADIIPIESEFASSEDAAAYDALFRAKVEKALVSKAPRISPDEAMAIVGDNIPETA